MSDILTMLWKESKDVLFQGGWRSLIRPLIVIGIMEFISHCNSGLSGWPSRHLQCFFCFGSLSL